MDKTITRARSFIYRQARPIDLFRWRYLFEGGKQADVLAALAHYQNEDGGFGHALEADSWNPQSTPIQTWCASEILREIHWTDSRHSLVQGLLRYLAGGADFIDGHWLNAPESNNDYPGAIWWKREPSTTEALTYNPTAALAGFALRHAELSSPLYSKAEALAIAAIEDFLQGEIHLDMHVCNSYLRLWEDLQTIEDTTPFHMDAFYLRLEETIARSLNSDPATWSGTYACKPSQFFSKNDPVFTAKYSDLITAELDYLVREQNEDGSWPVNWLWQTDYPREETLSINWWKADIIIKHIRFIQAFADSRTEKEFKHVR